MPYIENDERRKECDRVVKLMDEIGIKADGDLNYILFKYCKYCVKRSYGTIKNFRAELSEARDEIGRRLLSTHEDVKILDNGDV